MDRAAEQIERTLRAAVASHQYPAAEKLLDTYCEIAKSRLARLSAGTARHRGMLTQTLGTLEWARVMLHTSRAVHAASAKHVSALQRFLPTPAPEPPGSVNTRF